MTNATVQAESPGADRYGENLSRALKGGDLSLIERALLKLYEQLHGAGSAYSSYEKTLLAKRRGYSCHPGGLSPLIRAVEFVRPGSVVADLGAGNGLQGLLLQRLCPHRKTIQVEISSEMIRVGRIFQRALGISADCVEWVHDDIVNASIETADFIYTYLPAKPIEGGKEVYEAIARKLGRMKKTPYSLQRGRLSLKIPRRTVLHFLHGRPPHLFCQRVTFRVYTKCISVFLMQACVEQKHSGSSFVGGYSSASCLF